MKEEVITPLPPEGHPWRAYELMRRQRIREDAARPMAVNLAEGLILSEMASRMRDFLADGDQLVKHPPWTALASEGGPPS